MEITINKYGYEKDFGVFLNDVEECFANKDNFLYFDRTWRIVEYSVEQSLYGFYNTLKVVLAEVEDRGKEVSPKYSIKVSVEKVIYDSLKEIIQKINDEYGVAVTNVSVDFVERIDGKRVFSGIEVTTYSR